MQIQNVRGISGICVIVALAGLSNCQLGGEDFLVPFVADDDLQYIDAILPHHQMATEMAQREVDAGQDPQIKMMAQEMIDAQTAEIEELRAIRLRLAGSSQTPPWPDDSHMDLDMEEMAAASGATLDQLFLRNMIEHHSSGISIAHRALPNLTDAELIETAELVVTNQSREVGEMEPLLN